MSLRILKFATHLRPDDAYTLIECLDQMRDILMQNYGAEIAHMLQHDCMHGASELIDNDDVPF